MNGIFDSHAHYFDKRFAEAGGADAILRDEVFGKDVAYVLNVGTNNENNPLCVQMAGQYAGMYAAVGLHPEDCRYMAGDAEAETARLSALIGNEEERRAQKIVALGEIGLDYHWEGYDKGRQHAFFHAQMRLAEQTGLPVIIHDRDAHGDCFDVVRRYAGVQGVFHSYSGSAEMAAQLVRMGYYISFSGVVTFKNAARVREVAASIPDDYLLMETDCPYLAPEPHRGHLNHSGYLVHTAEALAACRHTTPECVIALTRRNACRLFGIDSQVS